VLERLGLRPLLELDLRLGEGTGAALAMSLVDAAVAIRDGMATFDSAGVAGATPATGVDGVETREPVP
jgi:nicotinate-nucleotide--dimethylbenzimidazole phosphoribosyltransferase